MTTPIDRRDFFQLGMAGMLSGLAVPQLSVAAPVPRHKPIRSCILIYLLGGPPHLDMWDPKPTAPAEIRGPFRPIATKVPGVQFSEHLPRLAGMADKLAVVRSVSYANNDHPYMIYYTLTGRVSPAPLGANTVLPPSRMDYPHMGSVVAKFKHSDWAVPGYVAIPEVRIRMQAVPVSGGGRAGFLGPSYDPFAINDDPRDPLSAIQLPTGVSTQRFESRGGLLAVLDGCAPRARAAQEHEAFRRSAGRLLSSPATRELFDLDKEPGPLRDRYGRHRFGQSMLLARRLAESGVSLIGIHFNHMTRCDGWDTHARNFDCLKDELLPLVDNSMSALLDDLDQRGLLEETLVVCMGEFGRTPRINGNAGRDHWGHCGSVVFAGGGIRGGQIIGSSDPIGAYPREQPVDPADIQASIYQRFGLDPHQEMHDRLGRPLPLSIGTPVRQLVE